MGRSFRDLLYLDEVVHGLDQSAGLGVVLTDDRLADLPEAQGPQALTRVPTGTDDALHLGDFQVCHGYAVPSRAADGGQRFALATCAQHCRRRDVLDGQTATGCHLFGALDHLQRGNGGMHHVDRVVATQRLGQHVVHAGAFQHRAARATGDDAGTGAGRTQHHDTGSGFALHGVDDGAADQRDAEEVLASLFDTLGDRGGNLFGLAVADTDHALAVTDDDQRGEAEAPTTLDDLGDAVDGDDALEVVALLAAAVAAAAATAVVTTATAAVTVVAATARPPPRLSAVPAAPALEAATAPSVDVCSAITRSFRWYALELQSVLTGSVGQSRDPPAVGVSAAVEHDGLDTGCLGTFGDELTDPDAVRLLVAFDGTHIGLDGRGGRNGRPGQVVDQLDVDVPRRAVDHQARDAQRCR